MFRRTKMTEQTIIDDAKDAGFGYAAGSFYLPLDRNGDLDILLPKFAKLRDARAKASKQAQGEAVIIDSVASGIINGKRQALPIGTKLFTAPPQPQTVADALEMATQLADEKDTCPKCGGSFKDTGGFPLTRKVGDADYYCQKCDSKVMMNEFYN